MGTKKYSKVSLLIRYNAHSDLLQFVTMLYLVNHLSSFDVGLYPPHFFHTSVQPHIVEAQETHTDLDREI